MDGELLKIAAAIFAGAMGLIGGILAFVNGRLKEAETSEEKFIVYFKTWQWMGNGLSIAAVLSLLFFETYLVSVIVFLLTFAIQIYLFLSLSAPIVRKDIVTLALLCSVCVSGLTFAALGSILKGVIDIQRGIIEVQKSMLNVESVNQKK